MPRLPAFNPGTKVSLSPHIVIVGAGGSLASCPNGDKNGKVLPVMNNFINVIGLTDVLAESGFHLNDGSNFEDFYDWLSRSNRRELLLDLEQRVQAYFCQIEIPETPTPYDYLILGLRPKDLIASFNWDPLLMQAYRRNASIKALPQIVFLHGNVSVAVCLKDRVKGLTGDSCGKCGSLLSPTKLLYPISEKNYSSDPFIANEWAILSHYLSDAYLLTIFGYSAPKTDAEAKRIMHTAWKNNATLELAEIEIVDIKAKKDLEETWKEFIIRHHYCVSDSIMQSLVSKYPRRSCEAFIQATLQMNPWKSNWFPQSNSLEELQDWVSPLLSEESSNEKIGTAFSGRPNVENE